MSLVVQLIIFELILFIRWERCYSHKIENDALIVVDCWLAKVRALAHDWMWFQSDWYSIPFELLGSSPTFIYRMSFSILIHVPGERRVNSTLCCWNWSLDWKWRMITGTRLIVMMHVNDFAAINFLSWELCESWIPSLGINELPEIWSTQWVRRKLHTFDWRQRCVD